jgi:hypothetical protein
VKNSNLALLYVLSSCQWEGIVDVIKSGCITFQVQIPKQISIHFSTLADALTRNPKVKAFVVWPLQRLEPKWYRDKIGLIRSSFQEEVQRMNQVGVLERFGNLSINSTSH